MNIEELKRLAEAATPGPWREVTTLENGFFEVIGDSKRVAHAFGNCRQEAIDNRRYIAAANPAVVLELIRQRSELLASLKEARELVEDWGAYAPAYMQEKHDLEGDMNKLDAAIARAEAP